MQVNVNFLYSVILCLDLNSNLKNANKLPFKLNVIDVLKK